MRVLFILLFITIVIHSNAQKRKNRERAGVLENVINVIPSSGKSLSYQVHQIVKIARSVDTLENRRLTYSFFAGGYGFGDSIHFQIENDSFVLSINHKTKSVSIFYKEASFEESSPFAVIRGLNRDSLINTILKTYDLFVNSNDVKGYSEILLVSKSKGSFGLPIVELHYLLNPETKEKVEVEVIRRSAVPQSKDDVPNSFIVELREGEDYILKEGLFYFRKEERFVWKLLETDFGKMKGIEISDVIFNNMGKMALTEKYKDYVLLDEKMF
ncbi:MAG: hypothetical protein K2P88_15705 [Chitinophagaceae bacterium]|nr:hypothetical protein [Chitinophagaceae bacterium]